MSYQKRTLPHTFFRRVRQASMTVEASMVLPLFLFFFLNLCSVMHIISLHNQLQFALWNAGRQVSVNEAALNDGEDGAPLITMERLAAGVYVKQKIVSMLGQEYLDGSPLKKGKDSLLCYSLTQKEDANYLDIRVTYEIAPMFSLAGFRSFRMTNRFFGYVWNGYHLKNEKEQDKYYVTKDSKVYHVRTTCTYLALSITKVNRQEYLQERNRQGLSVQACKRCAVKKEVPWVYVTKEGDCYHNDLNCGSLKRTIYTVSDKSGYRPCSRCAGKGESDGKNP